MSWSGTGLQAQAILKMILLLLVHMLNHGNYAGMKDPSLPRALHLFHMWFFGTKGNCAHWLLL